MLMVCSLQHLLCRLIINSMDISVQARAVSSSSTLLKYLPGSELADDVSTQYFDALLVE